MMRFTSACICRSTLVRLFALSLSTSVWAFDNEADPSFGNSGSVNLTLSNATLSGEFSLLFKLHEQLEASVLVAPKYWLGSEFFPNPAAGVTSALATARISSAGVQDMNYGTNGTRLTALPLVGIDDYVFASWQRTVFGVGTIAVNRIFVANVEPVAGVPTIRVCSVDANGQLISGFNPNTGVCAGYRFEDGFGASGTGNRVRLVADGNKLYVVGITIRAGGVQTLGVLRLNGEDGTLDTSYGLGGYSNTPISGMTLVSLTAALDPLGRLLILGVDTMNPPPAIEAGSNPKIGITRINSNGIRDSSFCAFAEPCDAMVDIASIGLSTEYVTGMAPTRSNIYLNAYSGGAAGRILALNSTGRVDRRFGTNGIREINALQNNQSVLLRAIKATPTGKLLLAGSASESAAGTVSTALFTRLQANGSCDPDFASTCPSQGAPIGLREASDVLLDSANRPLYYSWAPSGDRFRVTRFRAQQDLLADGFE